MKDSLIEDCLGLGGTQGWGEIAQRGACKLRLFRGGMVLKGKCLACCHPGRLVTLSGEVGG